MVCALAEITKEFSFPLHNRSDSGELVSLDNPAIKQAKPRN